ncbi:hypothetical protein CMO96_00985 [Candidatus Woesebacteria bacterium]|nr:hypothetical protein [Candidatus Woesebacteria bacterium]|tara:strand:+ start:1588 stop:2073 length:486 start_codon:yes stop_codon:yes gene_type:complete
MKILTISDSHGNIVRLKHTIGYATQANLDAIIHCGDWGTKDAADAMKGVKIPVYGVLGNADYDPRIATSLRKAKVKFNDDFLKLELGGRQIGICHFPGKLKNALKSQEYDVLFHGHTHRKKNEKHGKTILVNPGALQKADIPSFAVYDTEKNKVEFVDVAI